MIDLIVVVQWSLKSLWSLALGQKFPFSGWKVQQGGRLLPGGWEGSGPGGWAVQVVGLRRGNPSDPDPGETLP